MTLQGHPRSLILAPVDSGYRTSYWSSIVTLVLSCHVSEILSLVHIGDKIDFDFVDRAVDAQSTASRLAVDCKSTVSASQ